MTRVFENVEFFSRVRLERSIRRADVVLFLIDASVEVGTVEKKLASTVAEAYRPVIIVVNKWDLTRERDIDPERYVKYIGDRLPGLDFAPISFISAKDGFNVEATMELAEKLFQQSHTRVPTARLNEVVHEAVTRRSPPRRGNRQPNIFYATQVNVAPPTVVIFVSDDSLFSRSYVNYLQNALRAALPFDEVPVKVELRSRERSPAKFRRGPRPESPIPYQHRGPRKKRKR
jgi:GTP-binding protein